MIENSPFPFILIEMAELALGGKSSSKMIRFLGSSVIFIVAIETVQPCAVKSVLPVTIRTIQSPVHAS
jgi:hypothetical protein